jgi:hypothetical protein
MIGFVGVTTAANTSTSGSSVTVDTPAGIQPGDLLVAQFASRDQQATTSGWSRILYQNPSHSLHVRVVEASEPSSHTFSLDGGTSGRLAVGVTAWRGVDTAQPVEVAALGTYETSNGSTITAPSVSGSAGRLLRCWAAAATGYTEIVAPGGEGLTTRYTVSTGLTARPTITLADANYPGGPSGTSIASVPDATPSNRSGISIVLAPDEDPVGTVAATVDVQVATSGTLSVPDVFDPATLEVTVDGDTAHLGWPAPTFPDAAAVDVFRRGPYETEGEVDDSPFDPTVDAPVGRVPIGQTTFDDGPLSSGFYVWQVFPVRPQTSDGTVTANVEEYV